MAQGTPTAKLARELGLSRPHLLRLRHEIQARALAAADRSPLPDDRTEADEMYQNAGEKRGAAHRPARPSKAAGEPGQGSRHLGYRPACGTGGGWPYQRSAWVRVGRDSGADELIDATVLPATGPGAMVYTDEWNGYKPLARCGRGHATVNHNRGEFARDDDGDGVREVHCSTLEGIWTGLRNFLRPFRDVNKAYLEQYVIMFQ